MIRISLIVGFVLLLAGCSQTLASQTPDVAMPSSPIEGDATQMIQPLPTSSSFSLQNLIEKAKGDLAGRLSIDVVKINLAELTEVTWPDSSLGCLQKGMVSTQVLTPGYLILLEYNHNQYEYHANKNTYVIYCLNPTLPIFGSPNQ